MEVNPDIPLDTSSIEAVRERIQKNNSEVKGKYRLRLAEFLHRSFMELGVEAVDEEPKRQVVFDFLAELVERRKLLPENTAVTKVLHTWEHANLIDEGLDLVKRLLLYRDQVDAATRDKCFEERTITLALRLCAKSSDEHINDLMTQLMDCLPPHKFKRRMFPPILENANLTHDIQKALHCMDLAREHNVELWDADYHSILTNIDECASSALISPQQAQESVHRVLSIMELHHPVVGSANAALIGKLLSGKAADVRDSGECSRCGCQLALYDLTAEDRHEILDDLLTKLITPKLKGEKEQVAPEEVTRRWAEYEKFKDSLASSHYDTVIDGANVGYYGLSNWYRSAKDDLLRSRGINPDSVSLKERDVVPLPVDVSPKFSIIEDMRRRAEMQMQRKPLIILHQRHLESATGDNKSILAGWLSAGSVLAAPPFLNDDFCWLYAALIRPKTFIISNDQMRDHHFCMLSRRIFMRWRQGHCVKFMALYHAATATVSLNLKPPQKYSVWTQRASTSPNKTHWHVPFLEKIPVIHQGSNLVEAGQDDVELSKDGGDECSAWLCTLNE